MTMTATPYYNDPYEEPYTGRVACKTFTFAGTETIEETVVFSDVGLFGAQTIFIDAHAAGSGTMFTLEILESGITYAIAGTHQMFVPALCGNLQTVVRARLGAAGTVRVHWLTTRIAPSYL